MSSILLLASCSDNSNSISTNNDGDQASFREDVTKSKEKSEAAEEQEESEE